MEIQTIFQLVKEGKISKNEALEKLESDKANEKRKMTKTQQGIYKLSQFIEYSIRYNTAAAFILKKEVDSSNLREAIEQTLKKFPILGASFSNTNQDSSDMYYYQPEELNYRVETIRVEYFQMIETLLKEKQKPFSFDKEFLFNIKIVESDEKRILFCCFHHIIFDNYSANVFLAEVDRIYTELMTNTKIEAPEVHFDSNYEKEEENYLESDNYNQDKEFWKEKFSELSCFSPVFSEDIISAKEEQVIHLAINAIQKKAIEAYLPQTSLAAKLLSIITHAMKFLKDSEEPIIVGIPTSVRRGATWDEIGNFINMTALPLVPEDSLKQTSLKFQEELMDTLEHRFYPYMDLVDFLRKEKGLRQTTPFDFSYNYNKAIDKELSFVEEKVNSISQIGEYDLTFDITETTENLEIKIKYNSLIIQEDIAEKMKVNILKTIEDISINSSLSSSESFIGKFIDNTATFKHNPAIIYQNSSYNYEDLLLLARKLASKLSNQGIQQGMMVGVMTERSPEITLAFLALQLIGAVYVPIDDELPEERINYIIEKSKIENVIISDVVKRNTNLNIYNYISLKDIDNFEAININERQIWRGEDLAYVIFTSGSTGNPKGVKISNYSLVNFLSSMKKNLQLDDKMHILAITNISFDISLLELLLPLFVGGISEIVEKRITNDGILLLDKITHSSINFMQGTPATWKMLLEAGWTEKIDMSILIGGESFSEKLVGKLSRLVSHVWNVYGPTEATIWATLGKLHENKKILLGKPLANTSILICDENLNNVAETEIGEILISGACLAQGYLNNTAETEKRFVYTEKGELVYRTGDLARRLKGGNLEFIGRNDTQIKRKGFRIELSEIELKLQQHHAIEESVVLYDDKNEQILAFLLEENKEIDFSAFLKETLPEYMIPDKFLYKKYFPLTSNRKMDRKKLLEDVTNSIERPVGKENSADNELVALIRQQYGLTNEDIAAGKTFMDIGFDSVSLIKLSKNIKEVLDCTVSPADFYDHPVVKDFIKYFKEHHTAAISELTREVKSSKKSELKDIAIVGMACRMPESRNTQEFWDNLLSNRNLIKDIPTSRYNVNHYSDIVKPHNKGGFIEGIEEFDEKFFNISPKEAAIMDPQQRVLLEMTHHALEDAGFTSKDLLDEKVGVFIGATSNDYLELLLRETEIESHTLTGNTSAILSNRISYFFDFKGPSMTIDTACSSSLVSLVSAAESINKKESTIAIAGGISLMISPFTQVALAQSNMLSPSNQCSTFDQNADGYVRGEGGGLLVLKSLEQAVKDHDNIYAVFKGGAINHCGKTASITAPSSLAQTDVIKAALDTANVDAETITNIETHGSGTQLGDPIELKGVKSVYGHETDRDTQLCSLGSVKTNIGHLEAAAGIAGAIKMILSIKNKQIPASLNYSNLNDHIDLSNSRLTIQKDNKNWENIYQAGSLVPLRGGVSSFGFGGTNAHVILEEHIPQKIKSQQKAVYHCPLSCEYEEGLQVLAQDLLAFLTSHSEIELNDLVGTLRYGRSSKRYRVLLKITTITDFKELLQKFINHVPDNRILFKHSNLDNVLLEEKEWITNNISLWDKHSYGAYQTLGLPNYPFRKKKHWPLVITQNPNYSQKRKNVIVDDMTIEVDNKKYLFPFTLDSSAVYIHDHIVENQIVFPGAGYLEIVMEGVDSIFSKDCKFKIENLIFIQKMVFDSGQVKKCLLTFSMEDNENLKFKISDEQEIVNFVQGDIRLITQPASDSENIELVTEQAHIKMNRVDFYEKVKSEANIAYGNFYQLIEGISISDYQTVSKLFIPKEADLIHGRFQLNPALIDCAIQSTIPFLWKNQSNVEIPFMIEKISFKQALAGNEYYVQTINRNNNRKDIYLFNSHKECCLTITGYLSKEVGREISNDDYFFEATFLSEEAKAEPLSLIDTTIIYHQEDEAFPKIMRSINGSDIRKIEYTGIDVDSLSSMTVKSKRFHYFLNKADLMKKDCTLLIYLKRILTSLSNYQGNIQLHVVIPYVKNMAAEIQKKAVAAFISVGLLEFENMSINIDYLNCDFEQNSFEVYSFSSKELERKFLENQSGKFLVKSQEFVKTPMLTENQHSKLKKHGVYLIVGLGGIGKSLVRYLSLVYSATIVIISTGRLDDIRKKELEGFEKLGGKIIYIQADAGNLFEIQKIEKELEQRNYLLNGAFYTAMSLVNKPIIQLENQELHDSFKVKYAGTENIIKVFGKKSLDFILFFSSINAYIANKNQANYCSSCATQNELVTQYRKLGFLNLKLINWSFWSESGAVSKNEKIKNLMQSMGIHGITNSEGMEIIESFLKSDKPELTIFKAEEKAYQESKFKPMKSDPNKTENSEAIDVETVKVLDEKFNLLEDYSVELLWHFFEMNNLFTNENQYFTKEMIIKQLAVIPKYARLIDAFLYILEKYQLITATDKGFCRTSLNTNNPKKLLKNSLFFDEFKDYIQLIDICVKNYTSILSGEKSYIEIMYPDKSGDLVKDIYKNNQLADYYNKLLADLLVKYVQEKLQKNSRVKILEVGAGTGGTTRSCISNLKNFDNQIEYVYTDVSNNFLDIGKKSFGNELKNITFEKLNIETITQASLAVKEVDIVIASNVLHATSNMEQTLNNLKSLLREAGILLVNEVTAFKVFSTLTFGLTDGWWYFNDQRKEAHTPIMTLENWKQLILKTGYSSMEYKPEKEFFEQSSQHILEIFSLPEGEN